MRADDKEVTLAAALRLEQSMTGLTAELKELRTYGHRNRSLIWALALSLLLDVLLSVGLGVVAIQARDATSLAKRNVEAARVTCESGNEARRVSRQLWTYVLDLAATNPDQTPAQRRQLAQIRSVLVTVYVDRDCTSPSLMPSPAPTLPLPSVTPTR